nr:hypothetical protein BaRGS_025524 [Batillaria attramentaria]
MSTRKKNSVDDIPPANLARAPGTETTIFLQNPASNLQPWYWVQNQLQAAVKASLVWHSPLKNQKLEMFQDLKLRNEDLSKPFSQQTKRSPDSG